MTCHRLVLVLGLTLPIAAGTAHARQSNVSRDDRITPERLGLPKGNTRTSEPFVIRIYKTDDGGRPRRDPAPYWYRGRRRVQPLVRQTSLRLPPP